MWKISHNFLKTGLSGWQRIGIILLFCYWIILAFQGVSEYVRANPYLKINWSDEKAPDPKSTSLLFGEIKYRRLSQSEREDLIIERRNELETNCKPWQKKSESDKDFKNRACDSSDKDFYITIYKTTGRANFSANKSINIPKTLFLYFIVPPIFYIFILTLKYLFSFSKRRIISLYYWVKDGFRRSRSE